MNQKKIIQAIAAYLDQEVETYFNKSTGQKTRQFLKISSQLTHESFCLEIAAEIAAVITTHLEAGAGWEDAPSWAE